MDKHDIQFWTGIKPGSRLFLVLTSPTETIYLCVKMVDKNFDLRLCFMPDDFSLGDRQDHLNWDNKWLFQEPDDPDNLKFDELLYTTDFTRDEGDKKDISYTQKGQGELNGMVCETPQPSGCIDMIATIAEYNTDEQCNNPEAMFLEIGSAESSTGGCIKLLIGYPINAGEIGVKNL